MKRTQFIPEEEFLTTYLKEISKYRPVKADEEARLAKGIKKGRREALDKLVKANLRFVVSVARNYENQGVALTDLINEGNLGLIKAAKRFDETKNFKFISYAVWWIRQAILQALADQSRIVKLPLNRVGIIHKIIKAAERLEQKYGRMPSYDEIARELRLNESSVAESLKIGNRHVSLDAGLDEGEDATLLDMLKDEEMRSPADDAAEASFKRRVQRTLSNLDAREQEVIKLYFGLDDDAPHTLDEIGARLRLTRERVRQIKELALKRLKSESPRELLE